MNPSNTERLQEGARFGTYEILCEIGRGGMGAVYRAVAPGHGEVALKVLHADAHPDVARRFERETRIALEVRHLNIANALDAGAVDGRPYLASEFVDGVNVAQLVTTTGPLPENLTRIVARDIVAALAVLSEANTLHRDLKPQNILIGRDGSCRVVDFGLALPRTEPISLRTRTGAFLGTPLYVAPEQILGDGSAIDERCDLYALGCVLFYCLVGRAPYRGRSQFAILQQHLDAPIPDLAKLDVETSAEIRALIRSLLAKDPDLRPESAAVILAEREAWFLREETPSRSALGRRVSDSLRLIASLGTETRVEATPFVVSAEADPVHRPDDPERVLAVATTGPPGPSQLTLRSMGPGRRWAIDLVGGDSMTLDPSTEETGATVRVIDGAAILMPGANVEAFLNDRPLDGASRTLTRRARISLSGRTFNARLVGPPDDDQLLVGDSRVAWGPSVVVRTPAEADRSRVLVTGRFVLPGGAEIVAADDGLWLREELACTPLVPAETFRSGAIEVEVQRTPGAQDSRYASSS